MQRQMLTNATPQLPPKLMQMAALLRALNNPHKPLRFVHIAGTNGKGSTAAFLSTILRFAGYRTGLFTSPHLLHFHERIQVNGQPIPQEALQACMQRVEAAAQAAGVAQNFFRFATAAAMLYFQEEAVEIVVLETGLGGRLDPTNIIDTPEAALITRIGLDHMAYLGSSLKEIAGEKAGIIKRGGQVGMLRQEEAPTRVIVEACAQKGARLQMAMPLPIAYQHGLWQLETQYGHLPLGIGGSYQAENASLALLGVDILRLHGWDIDDDAVKKGLSQAKWPARFEYLRTSPPIVFDGAHNPQGAMAMVESLLVQTPGADFVFVMGTMQDKDYALSLAAIAPYAYAMVAVAPPDARALAAETLAGAMRAHCARVYAANDVHGALAAAEAMADGRCICVFGSLYLAGPVKAALQTGEMHHGA